MHLRAFTVAAAIMLGLFAWPTQGHAESEKVKTNQSANLHRRAGEQSPVILTLKPGQTVTLLAKDGRWLRVRVSGRTGWIPRSKVDMPQEDEDLVRNTRRQPFVGGRGTKRGFGGEAGPADRVGADAVEEGDAEPAKEVTEPKVSTGKPSGDAKPEVKVDAKPDSKDKADKGEDDDVEPAGDGDPEKVARPTARVASSTVIHQKPDSGSNEVFTADPKLVLYVGRTQGNWTRVSNEEGDAGWVLTTRLAVESEAERGSSEARRRIINGRGRLGGNVIIQSLALDGGRQTPPDNYNATGLAASVAVGGSLLYPVKQKLWLGVDLAYDLSYALRGVSYQEKTTGFTYHNLNAVATGGYSLESKRGTTLFARLGFHYDSYQVANYDDFTKNTARLPSQIVMGPTIGAAIAMPTLGRKWGVMISVDTMLVGGSLEQTKNLEDGTGPGAAAAFLGTSLVYRWKPKMDLQFTLDVDYTAVSFDGPAPATSLRGHMGTGTASGSDLSAALAAGINYAF